jgi:hypothetical protein
MMVKQIDSPTGVLNHWKKVPAPKDVIEYYNLSPEATYREVIMSIRADEACHRETNHFFAEISDDFDIGEEKTIVYNESPLKEKERKNVEGKSQPGENMKMD